MDDFPMGTGLVSPSESAFDALNTLSPPSPILTPSQVTFSWSSGDIPVLLYDEGYAENSSVSFNRMSIESAFSTHSDTGLPESVESSTTLASTGTFGLKNRRQTFRASQASDHSSCASLKSQTATSSDTRLSSGFDDEITTTPTRKTRTSAQSVSKVFYHPIVFVGADQAPNLSQTWYKNDKPSSVKLESSLEVTSQESLDVDAHCGTPPVCTQDNAKPVSWVSSRSWDYNEYHDFVANQGTSPRQLSVQKPSEAAHAESNASFVTDIDGSEAHVDDNETQVHEHPPGLDESQCHSDRLEQSNRRSLKPQGPVPALRPLPDHNWLEDVYVEFLIDQEGFRAAHPLFRFAGTVRRRPSTHAPSEVMAQFKPIVRQVFHFHYSPFETPPILRRVTVNGDDTHDYVSRQGLLVLKINGVYVLHGHEMPTGPDSDTSKLHWQFEYLVDDRVADTSGRVMVGEKTLTPLTFSCSPALMLPTQARKNSIMHVFKKGVAPKIHAEKLQPPGKIASTSGKAFDPSSLATSLTGAYTSLAAKAQDRRAHRRGESHGIWNTETTPKKRSSTSPHNYIDEGSTPAPKPLRVNPSPPLHMRRNSSAGEHGDSSIRLQFGNTIESSIGKNQLSGTINVTRMSHNFTPSSRHIIPPAKLAKMLEASEKENFGIRCSPIVDRNSNNFAPLAPRPRHATSKIRDTRL
ncbi:hypothetical protein HYPSUDRAFT_33742 [Hypholoma sublateritium FD-334 SS-4]|uniref:Uncharacterized protein n=1 Tax=Hypholoma sublateritium (strain FD-334 SS-4) TaxID=945553 RepID=A0A0D2PIT4_HYPSF|nr:hypothetical protein HYPSUDRAFT_33742 [Hypholoma sublateritium FD-334 SS-4]